MLEPSKVTVTADSIGASSSMSAALAHSQDRAL
jgi:hypothetical protein